MCHQGRSKVFWGLKQNLMWASPLMAIQQIFDQIWEYLIGYYFLLKHIFKQNKLKHKEKM